MPDSPKTALITGASSGIGAEFARQLAIQGYDLVLVARRTDRLTALAETLQARHGIQAATLTADLSEEAGIGEVEARLAAGDVHLLINNAGFDIGGPLAEAESAGQQAILQVHVAAPMRLMRAALPHMVAANGGGVINVASLTAFFSVPGHANYCATKAYLMHFSRAVHGEVRHKGVTVQALCPGFTITEMHDRTESARKERRKFPGFLWGSSEAVVHDSLVAFARGKSLCVPGALNRVLVWAGRIGLADVLIPFVLRE